MGTDAKNRFDKLIQRLKDADLAISRAYSSGATSLLSLFDARNDVIRDIIQAIRESIPAEDMVDAQLSQDETLYSIDSSLFEGIYLPECERVRVKHTSSENEDRYLLHLTTDSIAEMLRALGSS